MKIKGLWFYGFAGSGKSLGSKILSKKIKKSFIIDGDKVRKFISKDLSYKKKDRLKQINRILGISIITIQNNYFPIASTVFMNKQILNKAKKNNILVIEILRNKKEIIKSRHIYIRNKNIVGKDIKMPTLKSRKIINNKKKKFLNELNKITVK